MKRFEVWVTVWNKEHNAHTMKVAGVFNNFVCAKIFADAYEARYKTVPEIIAYVSKKRGL